MFLIGGFPERLFEADSQKSPGIHFLRGLRLSELLSLGQEPFQVSFPALGVSPEGCGNESLASSAGLPGNEASDLIRIDRWLL